MARKQTGTVIRLSFAIVMAVALVACGNSKKDDDDDQVAKVGTGDETGKADPATPRINAGEPKPKTVFSYPPKGPGPHEGFDLGAIRDKLQGAWLVGGSAFSSIPTVWYLSGDALVQIAESGERSESTLRLLAPCYFFEGTADGGTGSYGHFVFDGDTLYLGLGNAGLVAGEKTIGCMSVAMYVFENGACTAWTKKTFGKEGDYWDKEAGACGYNDGKSEFYGDDTNSSRKIYGKQSLNVRGNVLLTQQMEGNKADKYDSLAAALAEQKRRVDAKTALTKTPADLPFADWGVESVQPSHAQNDAVWAAAANRAGKWSLGVFRYEKFENGAVWVKSGNDAWAPSAFVHAAAGTAGLTKGAPALLAIGALMPYARFVKMDGDKAVVAYKSANQVRETTLDPKRVLSIEPAKWVFGAPVAFESEGRWADGQLVMDSGDDAFVYTGGAVEKLPKSRVRLVDTAKQWRKGDAVWAMQASGMSPLKFVKGSIEKVHGESVFFTIKADDGKIFDQTFDRIVAGL